jgi:hypothetical protein
MIPAIRFLSWYAAVAFSLAGKTCSSAAPDRMPGIKKYALRHGKEADILY